jgi:outer membrane protein insertion porin family
LRFRFIFILIIFLFPCSVISYAQGKKILDVQVEGNKNVSGATIISKIKVRPGQVYSQRLIDEDIKRLYETGFFTDIAVDLREKPEGLIVIFKVKETPWIDRIEFKGNRIFRAEKLMEFMKTKPAQFLDKWKLKTDIEEIKRKYLEKGYSNIDIKYQLDVDKNTNKAVINVIINEGIRVSVRKIEFSGNKAVKSKKLLKLMKTRKKRFFFTSGAYKEDVFKDDLDRIKSYYQGKGYLDVSLEPKLNYDKTGRWLYIKILVKEGKQYKVGKLNISGNKAFPTEELLKVLELKKEKPFSYEGLKQDVGKLQDFYFDKGYISAKIETIPVTDPKTGLVDISYKINENEIAYVNKIDIVGNVKTKDVVIRRELRLHPGDKFEGEKLKRSRQRLENLGYFEDINFDVKPTKEPNKDDLLVRVKETKTGEFSFGAGYSSVDEFIGFVELNQRNFDIANPPTFTGGGQRLSLRAEIGTVRKDYDLSFTEPWIFGNPLSFGFDLYQRTRERERDVGYAYDEKRKGGDLRLGKELSEYNRLYLKYRLDKIDISNVEEDASSALKAEEGKKDISGIGIRFVRDKRDSAFVPHKGYIMNLGLENAGGFIGGDVDFIRYTGRFSYFTPLPKDFILNFRLQSGIIKPYGDTDTVPIYERFFAGGAYTIRGYDERDVGPKDPSSNDPIGGEALLVGNVECTFPIFENVRGALFYDVGNVWADYTDFASGGYRSSIGVGVRLKTPIGPIKLDYGYGLNYPEGESSNGKIHFSMGHRF